MMTLQTPFCKFILESTIIYAISCDERTYGTVICLLKIEYQSCTYIMKLRN